ncbi:MAG: hypothetical protein RSD26_00800 [Cellulosilyticaceae bacterium]
MLRNRCKLKYKLSETEGQVSVIVDYFNIGPNKKEVRYKLFHDLLEDNGMIIQVNTRLILSGERLEPKAFIDKLLEKINKYKLKYVINRTNGEIYRMGLGRLFNLKQTTTGVVYKVEFYISPWTFTQELFEELLETYDVKCFICKKEIDIEETMELFYSGMIDDKDQNEFFEMAFYDNVNIEQMIIKAPVDYREKVVRTIENVKECCK